MVLLFTQSSNSYTAMPSTTNFWCHFGKFRRISIFQNKFYIYHPFAVLLFVLSAGSFECFSILIFICLLCIILVFFIAIITFVTTCCAVRLAHICCVCVCVSVPLTSGCMLLRVAHIIHYAFFLFAFDVCAFDLLYSFTFSIT